MASQKEMISKMIQVLKKLPEGTEITTFQLVRKPGSTFPFMIPRLCSRFTSPSLTKPRKTAWNWI